MLLRCPYSDIYCSKCVRGSLVVFEQLILVLLTFHQSRGSSEDVDGVLMEGLALTCFTDCTALHLSTLINVAPQQLLHKLSSFLHCQFRVS